MIITRTKQVLYSTLAILAGLCLSLLVHHTLTYFFAIIAGFKPILNLKGVVNLPVHYNSWTFERVILVHGIPSVLCISMAYIIIQIKRYAFVRFPSIRLFLFWFALSMTSIFTANMILSFFGYQKFNSDLYRGFALINDWMYFSRFTVIIMGMISVIIQYYIGTLLIKDFMVFIADQELAEDVLERLKYLIFMLVIPLIGGSLVYFFFTYPQEVEYALLRLGLISLSMAVVFLVNTGPVDIVLTEIVDIRKDNPIWLLLLSLLVFSCFWMAFYRYA